MTSAATPDDELADGDPSPGPPSRARDFVREGDYAAALPLLQAAAAKMPRNPKVLARLARVLEQLGRVAEAEAVYRRILKQNPAHAVARSKLGRGESRDGGEAEGAGDVEAPPLPDRDNPKATLRLGQRLLKQWRMDKAERAFRRVLAVEPANFEAMVGLARCVGISGDKQEALTLLRTADALQPGKYMVGWWLRQLEGGPARMDWGQELVEATTQLRDAVSPLGVRIAAAQRLLPYGVTDVVLEALAPLEARSIQVRRIVQIARQLDRSGLSQSTQPPGSSADPDLARHDAVTGVVERLTPGAEALLLVFSGGMNRAFLSLDVLHRLLRKTGASVVYLRDLERTYYRGGVVGLGADFAATTRALAAVRAGSGARRLLMFGNCTGCEGALRYGLALGADAVLGVSPRAGAAAEQALSKAERAKLDALLDGVPQYAGDFTDLYAAAGAAAPRVTLVAGETAEPEASFARDMATKVPGVVHAAMPGVSEECFGDILGRGLFPSLFASYIADGELSPEVLKGLRQAAPGGRARSGQSPFRRVSP